MRIKLVTFAPNPNFGTCLQSYALNKVLKDMGHKVEFIYNGREAPKKSFGEYMRQFIKALLPASMINRIRENREGLTTKTNSLPPSILVLPDSSFLYHLSKLPFYDIFYKAIKCRTRQRRKVYKFAYEDGNYNMKRLYTKKQYEDVVNDADLFITGSDQIWNPYCGGYNPMMFLEFAQNKKRIAYSSSIARPRFPIEVESRAEAALSKFQHIAVREKSSVDMLNNLLKRNDVKLVVDPTVLLSKEEWIDFGNRANIEFDLPEQYILCYFIGERKEYKDMVYDVMNKTGINNVITIDCSEGFVHYGDGLLYKDGGPYEFVYLINHASWVCMDSFHATIFSLKFGVDFVHILKTKADNSVESQNSRMYDLFQRYGLMHKLYDANSTEWLNPIDFNVVNELMNKDIQDSYGFLRYEIES